MLTECQLCLKQICWHCGDNYRDCECKGYGTCNKHKIKDKHGKKVGRKFDRKAGKACVPCLKEKKEKGVFAFTERLKLDHDHNLCGKHVWTGKDDPIDGINLKEAKESGDYCFQERK
jgi:hypothetical protein